MSCIAEIRIEFYEIERAKNDPALGRFWARIDKRTSKSEKTQFGNPIWDWVTALEGAPFLKIDKEAKLICQKEIFDAIQCIQLSILGLSDEPIFNMPEGVRYPK